MILVDSTVWVDYFNGKSTRQTDLLDQKLGIEPIVIGDLIYTEVLQGFQKDPDFEYAKKLLDTLFFQEMLGQSIALASAMNYRLLRRRGVTVRKTIDVMIGTFCIQNDLALLHHDRDFDPMVKYLGLNAA